MTKNLVVVESPAKAKTINKYLGADYTVLASYGHIRDLPAKDGSVDPENNFAMQWELSDRAGKPVGEMVKALKGAQNLYLASDPDREGEAIAWHVEKVLREKGALKNVQVQRITFNEITKQAVQHAIAQPRQVDEQLVQAYLARRALDYLVGFSLSPVLWRKLPGSKSAGRVQSVALRLVCERESEIEKFVRQEYWTISTSFLTATQQTVPARLYSLAGKKLDKFDVTTEAAANALVQRLSVTDYAVTEVERKQARRNPYPPFTTSTLQMDAARKLYFSASRTMRLAQQLYEGVTIGGETVGLITYMRTDGVQMAAEAVASIRAQIAKDYGNNYLPPAARVYTSKSKNAQEAHEAIRPTDIRRRPADVAAYLEEDQLKLYTLIWQRTMAAQMAAAVLDQVSVDISSATANATFRANGSVVQFPGYLAVYQEGVDDDAQDDDAKRLPDLTQGQQLQRQEVKPNQHFTEPPPRYSEASLVKALEELGIGRPSTYASIMQVLQDRSYVRLEKRRFVPEDRGRLVTAFLSNFFTRYVQYDFTAKLEEQLDDISGGRADWQRVLHDFWHDFSGAIGETKELRVTNVLDVLDADLGPHFFPPRTDGSDARACPKCADEGRTGRLGLKLGKFGAFIGCSNYPTCGYTRQLAVAGGEDAAGAAAQADVRELGMNATGLPVSVRRGPYGAYVQLGPNPNTTGPNFVPPVVEEVTDKKTKGKKSKTKTAKVKAEVKRVSLPRGVQPADVDIELALKLLTLPRDVGAHPETGEMISAGVGRFGPYLKMGNTYKSLTKDDDVLEIGLNRAVVLLAEVKPKAPAVELGLHPENGKPITKAISRFGPYLKWGKVMVTVPKTLRDAELTLEQAVALLATKQTGAKKSAAKQGKTKTVTAGKVTTEKTKESKSKSEQKTKTTNKKPAAKKSAAKKTKK